MGKSTVAAMFAEPACRCSTPMPRCTGCRARAARWSRRSKRRFPGTTGAGGRRSHRARRSGVRRLRERSRGSRRSSIPRSREARARSSRAHRRRAAGGARHPAAVRNGGGEEVDAIAVVSAPRRGPARARARPARHDAGEVRSASSPCSCPTPRSARAPISSSTPAARWTRHARAVRAHRSLASAPAQADNSRACAKSCSIPKPPGSIRRRRPDGRDRLHRAGQPGRDRADLPRLFQSRARRCRPRRAGVHGLSDAFLADKPLLRDDVSRSCSSSSATPAGRAQRRLRLRLPQRRARRAAAGRWSARRG